MSGLSLVNVVPIARDERLDSREWSDASAPAKRTYLDHGASTPSDPAVIALMEQVMAHEFAKPSSSHQAGRRAARHIEEARDQVADAVRALPEEIVFTSGATESNNLAILGVAAAAEERGGSRRRIVTLGIEHPSVRESCRHLTKADSSSLSLRCSGAAWSIWMRLKRPSGTTRCCSPSRPPTTRSAPLSRSLTRSASPMSTAHWFTAMQPRRSGRLRSTLKLSASVSQSM